METARSGQRGAAPTPTPMLTQCLWSPVARARLDSQPRMVGVLPGEGIGPECIDAALQVLTALEAIGGPPIQLRMGPRAPLAPDQDTRPQLVAEVNSFCCEVFAEGGAILTGPFGGRFVYDQRKHFDLFCKLTPIRVSPEMAQLGRLRPEHAEGVDLVLVRENTSGIYLGRAEATTDPTRGCVVSHSFDYAEQEVRRIVEVAARIAASRRGELLVVVKEGGLPEMTALWRECADAAAGEFGVRASLANIDRAAYDLVQHARELDVVVAGNLFGDVLADVAAVLLGSRALACSGNFSGAGAAVYQTNHGAAWDLVGSDRANPLGQLYSLAMLLRESFGLVREADLVDAAVASVLRQGYRTVDLAQPADRVVGTQEMTGLVTNALAQLGATAAP